jgi:hypothetical protein
MAIENIYWPFGIFCGNLVYFPRLGILDQEKSGNPAAGGQEVENADGWLRLISGLSLDRSGTREIRSKKVLFELKIYYWLTGLLDFFALHNTKAG